MIAPEREQGHANSPARFAHIIINFYRNNFLPPHKSNNFLDKVHLKECPLFRMYGVAHDSRV